MGEYANEVRPAICFSEGQSCETCTRGTGRHIGALCPNLSADGLEQIFFRMYPDKGCLSALPLFAQSYFAATAPRLAAA